ncbi:hypothetical protein ACUOCP_55085, partial [Escherichia sp. R-CC3]
CAPTYMMEAPYVPEDFKRSFYSAHIDRDYIHLFDLISNHVELNPVGVFQKGMEESNYKTIF